MQIAESLKSKKCKSYTILKESLKNIFIKILWKKSAHNKCKSFQMLLTFWPIMTNNSTLWYVSQLFHIEGGRWGDLNLLSSSSSSSGWYTCSGAFVLVQGASEVDWETSFRGVFSYRPLAPWKMLSFRPNRGFPRSKSLQLRAEMRMTKARQLSPEGGEKCGFFLRGGHASFAAAVQFDEVPDTGWPLQAWVKCQTLKASEYFRCKY